VCNATAPLQPVNKVLGQVDKGLREDFAKAIQERADSDIWPEGVASRKVKDKVHLYLKDFPPSPPLAPKKAPAAELSEKLVEKLREQKAASGDGYPLSVAALLEKADPDTKPALLKRAMVEEPFLSKAAVAVLEKMDAPVALAADRAALAESPLLLEYLLNTVKKHPVALAHLAEAVTVDLRPTFLAAVKRQAEAGALPSKVGMQSKDGELLIYLKEKMPVEAILRERLLDGLKALRDEPGYPPTLARLLQKEAEGTSAALIEKVLADKAFKSKVVLAVPDNRESPVALKDDEEKLAGSPVLLELVVHLLSTPEKPLHPLAKIAGKLDKSIREAFAKSVEQRIQEKTLPKTLWAEEVKSKPYLGLERYKPVFPPEEELARKLVAALRAQRGQDEYPRLLSALLQEANEADQKVVDGALAHKLFRIAAVVVPVPGREGALVALLEDRDLVAGDDRMLEGALKAARTDDDQALELGALKKKVAKEEQGLFGAVIEKEIAENDLPPRPVRPMSPWTNRWKWTPGRWVPPGWPG